MYAKKQQINWISVRIALIAVFFALGTVLLILRAYRLQISDSDMLKKRAEKQRTRVLQLEARRGMILDRSGELMAASLEVKSIYAQPRLIEDKSRTAEVLADALEMNQKDVLAKMRDDKPFVWIRRKVSPLMADKVKKADLKGVFSVTEFKRFYPAQGAGRSRGGFCRHRFQGAGRVGAPLR